MNLCEVTGEFKITMPIPLRISDEEDKDRILIPIPDEKTITSKFVQKKNNKKKNNKKKGRKKK